MKKLYQRYVDECIWRDVSEKRAKEILSSDYKNADLAIEDLKRVGELRTTFSQFKYASARPDSRE